VRCSVRHGWSDQEEKGRSRNRISYPCTDECSGGSEHRAMAAKKRMFHFPAGGDTLSVADPGPGEARTLFREP
jgi:hypothetical protein